MTAAGIIEQYNSERSNTVEDDLKLNWLKKVEMSIIDSVITTHQGSPDADELNEHIENFGMQTEMIVDEPYDDLYIYFLDQRIAIDNNDSKRYNTAVALYNNALLTFQQKYNREHMSLRSRNYMLRHEVL